MNYFVTGATGLIGRHLVEELLKREGTIYALCRPGSEEKLERLRTRWATDKERVVGVIGDLGKPNLGIDPKVRSALANKIDHVFHLAAIYDLTATAEEQERVNVEGTRRVIDFTHEVSAGTLHLVSSIAAAGLYDGIFTEDMFEEAENLSDPYFRTKHESEGLVRRTCKRPWRIYRPSIVVGHSETGEMDKIDGPYYFFKTLQKARNLIPPWFPMVGLEGRRVNIVPVDFVARALDHIAHVPDLDGRCFHLTDPKPLRVGEVLNTFSRAAHGPQMTMRVDSRMFAFVPKGIRTALMMLKPIRRITDQILGDLGLPRSVLRYLNYPTRFDCRETQRLLAETDIRVPALSSYADRLWDYWERHLDPDLFIDRTLAGRVRDRVVVITGGSSGIGESVAYKVAEAGAITVLVARRQEELDRVQRAIETAGGRAHTYTCDLSDLDEGAGLVERIIADHGAVDVLINNAGRSIRRSIAHSFDRFHDFERTMQLNYFGSLRLIMSVLPHMLERKHGHVVNISSIGVLTNSPRFSAYVASKAALDAFSRCAGAELSDSGVYFTTINMPLVRTPMIAPTKIYQSVPAISPEEAADMVAEAIVHRPKRIATRLGTFAQMLYAVAPKSVDVIMNSAFKLFPDSSKSRGKSQKHTPASTEQVAFAYLMRGIHW